MISEAKEINGVIIIDDGESTTYFSLDGLKPMILAERKVHGTDQVLEIVSKSCALCGVPIPGGDASFYDVFLRCCQCQLATRFGLNSHKNSRILQSRTRTACFARRCSLVLSK